MIVSVGQIAEKTFESLSVSVFRVRNPSHRHLTVFKAGGYIINYMHFFILTHRPQDSLWRCASPRTQPSRSRHSKSPGRSNLYILTLCLLYLLSLKLDIVTPASFGIYFGNPKYDWGFMTVRHR